MSEIAIDQSSKSCKWASKTKTSLFPSTVTTSNRSINLRSELCSNTSSFHTSTNSLLTQWTSPLNRDPPFDKSNFICLMGVSPNLNAPITYSRSVFFGLQYYIPPTLVSRFKHWENQTKWLGTQAVVHVPTFLCQEHCMYQTTCP